MDLTWQGSISVTKKQPPANLATRFLSKEDGESKIDGTNLFLMSVRLEALSLQDLGIKQKHGKFDAWLAHQNVCVTVTHQTEGCKIKISPKNCALIGVKDPQSHINPIIFFSGMLFGCCMLRIFAHERALFTHCSVN